MIDDIPCLELPPGTIMIKRKIKRVNNTNRPFTFGLLQEEKERKLMPDIIKELQNIFRFPLSPATWKIYKITEDGEIKELEEDDEE